MKKIMMTLVAAVMALTASAQAYVGGGIGFATADNGNDDVTSFKFLPEVGYSFNPDWSAGVVFGWEGANKGSAKTVEINPYARYTFVKGKVVSVFLDGTVGYSHLYNAGYDTDKLFAGLKPGVAVSLGDHLSFVTHVGAIGYTHSKDNKTNAKLNTWGVDLDGNDIVLGLYYSF